MEVQKYEGVKKSGLFVIPGHGEIYGDLTLQGPKTLLELNAKDFFDVQSIRGGSILGTLHDRTKVSLVDCVTAGAGGGNRGSERYHFASVFPHYVLFGNEHITAIDETIASAHFVIDDAATLFYDSDAFGMAIGDRSNIIETILDAKSELQPRKVSLGPRAEIFYFTGKREIFHVETLIGTISATHNISYKFPGPEGFHLKNRIVINIDFPIPSSITDVITNVLTLTRFLEVIVGRPQNIVDLRFRLVSTLDPPMMLDVYWCMPPKREDEISDKSPHPADTLMDAAREPEIFGNVLARWLQRHPEWREARYRFSSAFSEQGQYSIDRLVGAANMFDILPTSAIPTPIELSGELVAAQKKCREEFSKLPDSPERSSILNALGRLGTNTLKRKIKNRAKMIGDTTDNKFPNLDVVVDEAVNCRNYFVHGTESKISYSDNSDFLIFFTKTLEFIFAASDLMESGWDIGAWSKRHISMSHPFGRYRVNYATALSELTKALTKSKNHRCRT